MKIFMSYAFLALFFIGFASSFSTASTFESTTAVRKTTGFDYFRVHRQGSGAALSWSAVDAVSFQVERSYDGTFFHTVTSIEAGDQSSYKFKDTTVFPGTIYYRIGAVRADGTVEYSATESVRIVKHG
jgi:hypothetical protein